MLELNLRFITVERNGFGQTEFDDSLTMADYVDDVVQVLSHLNIDKFALFGISGGVATRQSLLEAMPNLSIVYAVTNETLQLA